MIIEIPCYCLNVMPCLLYAQAALDIVNDELTR